MRIFTVTGQVALATATTLIGLAGFGVPFLAIAGVNAPAQAATINASLPEFNSTESAPDTTYPLEPVTVGSFSYAIPKGEAITSAVISGIFGNTTVNSSAGADLFLDDISVGQCLKGGTCFSATTPWSYSFKPENFSALADGVAELTANQTSEYNVRLGETNLTVQTASTSVPEPSTVIGLVALGAGATLLKRKKSQGV